MLTVRLKAADIKLLRNPLTDPVIARDLMLTRVEEAETLRDINKGAKKYEGLGVNDAATILRGELGSDLKIPPNPDAVWYSRVATTIKRHGLDADYLTSLARHAKANLRPPYSMDFLIGQHMQILAGKYDQSRPMAPGNVSPQRRAYIEEKLA